MTEAEWASCTDPRQMLLFLRDKGSARKRRLFAVACCRRVWGSLTDPRSREAVEASERRAEAGRRAKGVASAEAACASAQRAARRAMSAAGMMRLNAAWAAAYLFEESDWAAAENASCCAANVAAWQAVPDGRPDAAPGRDSPAHLAEKAAQAGLLRCIFGNPFRGQAAAPAWRTPEVVSLAQAAYDDRRLPEGALNPARLWVLADALLDAGCDDAELLGHLRGEGPHVRGCWAVDLVLAKE